MLTASTYLLCTVLSIVSSCSKVIQSVAVCPVVQPFQQLDPNLPNTHGNAADKTYGQFDLMPYHTVAFSLLRRMLQSSISQQVQGPKATVSAQA